VETVHPLGEAARLAAVKGLRIVGTQREERFDRVTRAAASVFRASSALVSLLDEDREWVKSKVGLADRETPRQGSFAEHVVSTDQALVVSDAAIDERFVDHPWVIGEPFIRFYAGVPLRSPQKVPLGALAIMDRMPREFAETDAAALRDLGAWAEYELNHDPHVDPEAEMRRRQKDFLSRIAHQLRTPMTAILGFSDLLEGTAPDSASAAEYVAIIRANAERLNTLLSELLEGVGARPSR
jgi:GAF domain-containing protein